MNETDKEIDLHILIDITSSSKWLNIVSNDFKFSFEYRTVHNHVPRRVITGFGGRGKPGARFLNVSTLHSRISFSNLRPNNQYFKIVLY